MGRHQQQVIRTRRCNVLAVKRADMESFWKRRDACELVLEHWGDDDHGAEAVAQEAFRRGSFDNITGAFHTAAHLL